MADSRVLLVSLSSLRRCWVEQFARSIKPAVDAGFALLWHCDGNLMELIPDLLEAGVNGFQGFQYEDGMDYAKICRMRDREGRPLFIQAGVSVSGRERSPDGSLPLHVQLLHARYAMGKHRSGCRGIPVLSESRTALKAGCSARAVSLSAPS